MMYVICSCMTMPQLPKHVNFQLAFRTVNISQHHNCFPNCQEIVGHWSGSANKHWVAAARRIAIALHSFLIAMIPQDNTHKWFFLLMPPFNGTAMLLASWER